MPHARKTSTLWGALLGVGLLASTGCVSPRDIRVLQSQIDELRREQVRLSAQAARLDSLATSGEGSTRGMVVDVKHSVSDLDMRVLELTARLADLESRAGGPVRVAPEPEPLPATTIPTDAGAQPLYERAFEELKQENHAAAITGFRAYLASAPAGSEAASAAFWIGESFAALGQSDSALLNYQVVIDRHPQSPKVPAALLRSGSLYEARGEKEKAYPYFRRLKEEYPQSLEYQQLRRQLED